MLGRVKISKCDKEVLSTLNTKISFVHTAEISQGGSPPLRDQTTGLVNRPYVGPDQEKRYIFVFSMKNTEQDSYTNIRDQTTGLVNRPHVQSKHSPLADELVF